MLLKELVQEGQLYSFYGINQNCFKLGTITFEALPDPDDGYRSHLDNISIINETKIFQRKPIANVYIHEYDDYTYLTDENKHVWLTIGTNHDCNYYPYFVFKYTPDITQSEYVDELCPKYLHPEKMI